MRFIASMRITTHYSRQTAERHETTGAGEMTGRGSGDFLFQDFDPPLKVLEFLPDERRDLPDGRFDGRQSLLHATQPLVVLARKLEELFEKMVRPVKTVSFFRHTRMLHPSGFPVKDIPTRCGS